MTFVVTRGGGGKTGGRWSKGTNFQPVRSTRDVMYTMMIIANTAA